MNKLFLTTILALGFLTIGVCAQDADFFRTVAGRWEGTLEYRDYSEDKRVKLKTYLTIEPSKDGNSAAFLTVYDDFGRIIKDRETYAIDRAAKTYSAGGFEYRIESAEAGRIVLLARGQDGDTVEPIRETIVYDENSLDILKETRTPWRFRSRLALRRTTEDVLAPKTFAAAQLRADLEVLKKTVEAVHPGIYRYLTRDSLERAFAGFESEIRDGMSEGEFFGLVARAANIFDCGHTFANPYNQNSLLRERLFGGRTYLPFYFRIVDRRIVVTDDASGKGLSKGSEITKINGIPARKIIEKLLAATKGDGRNALANRLQSLELTRFEAERYALFDWYFPLFFPLRDEALTIEARDFATGRTMKFRTPALTKDERTREMAKRAGPSPTYDDGWKFELRADSTAYLKIENSITWRLKKIDFRKFLADAFAALRARNVKDLIVDLRGNGGGDTDVGFELARYLARKELPPYLAGRRLVRNVAPRPELLGDLDTYSDELKNELKNGVAPALYRPAENGFFEILPNANATDYPAVTPAADHFTGRVYLVADSSNASATFQFLDYAQRNRLGTIVGQPTGGSKQGINGGHYYFLSLPNSRVEIDIPVYFQAPFERRRDEGVRPDVPVERRPADIGRGFDRELAVIKDLIGKNRRRDEAGK